MPIKFIFIFTLVLSALDSVTAQENHLLGCWKIDSAITYLADGNTRKSSFECYDFFDPTSVTNTCVSEIGIVRPHRTDAYKVTENGRLVVAPGPYQNAAKEYDITVDSAALTRTQVFDTPTSNGPSAVVKQVMSATRQSASTAAECLPQPVVISEADGAKYWSVVEMVSRELESSVSFMAMLKFLQGSPQPFPRDALSLQDQASVIAELNQIGLDAALPIRQAAQGMPSRILEIFFQRGYCGDALKDPELASPLKQAWVKDSVKEIISSQRLANYVPVLKLLAPDKVLELSKNDLRDQPSKDYGLGRNYLVQREVLLRFSESSWLQAVLPEGPQLQSLSQLARKNNEIAIAKRFNSPYCLEKGIGQAAYELGAKELRDVIDFELTRSESRIIELKKRVDYLIRKR